MSESSTSAHAPRRRLGAALVAVAAVLLVASAAVGQGDVLPGELDPPWDDGAQPAEVTPGLENVRPVTWDHVLVGPDGRTLAVYFWNGPPECAGLADVQVGEGMGGTSILLWVGDRPGAEVCVDIAQLYRARTRSRA